MVLQREKATREGKNDKNDNFEMDIIQEGALDKSITVPEKHLTKKYWKKIHEVNNDEYFKISDVEYSIQLLLKCREDFNVSHFIPVDVKKEIQ